MQPYKDLGRLIEGQVDELGDQDIISMLTVYTELDQSYEGFYGTRAALERALSGRDTNEMMKQALEHGMNYQ